LVRSNALLPEMCGAPAIAAFGMAVIRFKTSQAAERTPDSFAPQTKGAGAVSAPRAAGRCGFSPELARLRQPPAGWVVQHAEVFGQTQREVDHGIELDAPRVPRQRSVEPRHDGGIAGYVSCGRGHQWSG
jgi:hypothetical protein